MSICSSYFAREIEELRHCEHSKLDEFRNLYRLNFPADSWQRIQQFSSTEMDEARTKQVFVHYHEPLKRELVSALSFRNRVGFALWTLNHNLFGLRDVTLPPIRRHFS